MADSSSRLLTIEDHHRCPIDSEGIVVDGAHPAEPSTWAIAKKARENGLLIPKARGLDSGIDAYVNHGRWVVDCPRCPSAQLVSPDDPKFWCPECGSDGVWWEIRFPDNRADIEDALLMRPNDSNRNWLTHETADDLLAENEVRL